MAICVSRRSTMQEEEHSEEDSGRKQAPRHVGGVNEELGGVDPEIDQALMRLSDGP
jgi:hypothetical protein